VLEPQELSGSGVAKEMVALRSATVQVYGERRAVHARRKHLELTGRLNAKPGIDAFGQRREHTRSGEHALMLRMGARQRTQRGYRRQQVAKAERAEYEQPMPYRA
jgi:hypothetical protein